MKHFEKQTRNARMKNWGQEPYLLRLTLNLYEEDQQKLRELGESLSDDIKHEIRILKEKLTEIPREKLISCVSNHGTSTYNFPAVITEKEQESFDNCFMKIYYETFTCQGAMTVRIIGEKQEKNLVFGIAFGNDGTWKPISKEEMEDAHCTDSHGERIPPEPNTIYTEIER